MTSRPDRSRALLVKAEGDRYVLERLASDPDAPNWVLGFHAQQAVEKALKAVLSVRGVEFPRTHNLAMLLELLRRACGAPPPDGDDLARLIPFGVAFRYEDGTDEDGPSLDRDWAMAALARTLRWASDELRSDELRRSG